MASVELSKVTKIFDKNVMAVDSADIFIKDKEFVVLVGPSGCGKSTTLRMIAGLEDISSGIIRIGERVVNDVPPKDRDIAMVFQNYALYPHMTVYENMAFGLKLRKYPKKEIDERVKDAAEILGIMSLLQRKPKALSGGQRQRVAVGRAIVRKPQVFLFDEPLSNLDAKLRVQMRTEISKLHSRLGTTMVYVTHDQIEAMTLSDRIVVMNLGVIEQIGTPVEMYRFPTSSFVADFIGRANFVAGQVKEQNGQELVLEALDEVVTLKNIRRDFTRDEAVSLIVRPEMIRVKKSGELFHGTIRRAVYLGDVIEYDVEVCGQILTGVETDPYVMELFPEGEQVTVGFAEGCIQVLPAQTN